MLKISIQSFALGVTLGFCTFAFAVPCENEMSGPATEHLYVKSLIDRGLNDVFAAKLILQSRLNRTSHYRTLRRLRSLKKEATEFEMWLTNLSTGDAQTALEALDEETLARLRTLSETVADEFGMPEADPPRAFGNRSRETFRFDDWSQPPTSDDTGFGR